MKSYAVLLFSLAILTTGYAQTNLWQSSGNIGIGTTSPGASTKLEVVGSGLFSGSASSDPGDGSPAGTRIGFRSDQSYGFVQTMKTGVQYYPLSLNPGGGSVGIGTTTPQAKLDLRGSFISGTTDFANGVSGSFLQIQQGATYGNTYSSIGAYSAGGAAWNNLVFQVGGGNVGIGTSSPTNTFEIQGNTTGHGGTGSVVRIVQNGGWSLNNPYALDVTGYSNFGGIRINGADGRRAIYANAGALGIGTDGGDITFDPAVSFTAMSIKPSGNVGIGTTNPTEKLSVNGRIRAQEVVVDNNNWSDYVFAKGYHLASLSEVEQHIQTQGHLPGVPSAQEVSEKGVSVGDMQAVLLAKIEELTLHVIAQEKYQVAQERALIVLQTKVATLETENARLTAVAK